MTGILVAQFRLDPEICLVPERRPRHVGFVKVVVPALRPWLISHGNSTSLMPLSGPSALFALLCFCTSFGSLHAGEPFLFSQIHDRSGTGSDAAVSRLVGTAIPLNTPIILGPRSRAEFGNSHCLVRVGAGSEVEILADLSLCLSRGSVLVQPRNGKVRLELSTKKAAFSVSGTGCFVVEATSNGGCKVISLSDSIDVLAKSNASSKIAPGNLLFVVPEETGFGPRLDVDLNVFRLTSGLVNGFDMPLESLPSIKTAAFRQSFKIKGRTNALIGDAKSSKNYDVVFLK